MRVCILMSALYFSVSTSGEFTTQQNFRLGDSQHTTGNTAGYQYRALQQQRLLCTTPKALLQTTTDNDLLT